MDPTKRYRPFSLSTGKVASIDCFIHQPDEEQKELMQRTANHLLASPNPTQLEMRILANHGTDKRFDFLRGRWARAWNLLKAKERQRKQNIADASSVKPLGTLAGYGSDDASEGSS